MQKKDDNAISHATFVKRYQLAVIQLTVGCC